MYTKALHRHYAPSEALLPVPPSVAAGAVPLAADGLGVAERAVVVAAAVVPPFELELSRLWKKF